MSLKRLFFHDLNETKLLIRRRIEEEAEATFENERRKEYALGALEFGEDIMLMTNAQKEERRIKYLKELELRRTTINMLWERMIERTAKFQISIDIFNFVGLIAGLLALVFGFFEAGIVLFIAILIVFLFSKTPRLFQIVMYLACGSGHISDMLLEEYSQYGRLEAAITFADYRGFYLSGGDGRKKWIFTPSHVVSDDDFVEDDNFASEDDKKDP